MEFTKNLILLRDKKTSISKLKPMHCYWEKSMLLPFLNLLQKILKCLEKMGNKKEVIIYMKMISNSKLNMIKNCKVLLYLLDLYDIFIFKVFF